MKQKVFNVTNKELVLQEIAKLQPLNYNQFRWWRRFDQPNKPLHKNASLLDKIQNGDLEFSHYWWQAKYTEIEMNEILENCIDYQDWSEKTQVDRARRRRLWEDFEKDEAEKLSYIRKEFSKEFRMTEEDYEDEITKFDGSLEELYRHCEIKYGKKIRIKSKRGRPRKNL
jgi:uncharacterized protein YndB with AHSA1/START domain